MRQDAPSESYLACVLLPLRGRVLAFVRSRMPPELHARVDADDIVQDTYLAAWKEYSAVGQRWRDPFAWLCHLARQRVVDAWRYHVRAQKRRSCPPPPVSDAATRPGESSDRLSTTAFTESTASRVFARRERDDRLQDLLRQLPAESQDILRMRYFDGLSAKEIASRLQTSDVVVRGKLFRVHARLRAELKMNRDSAQR